MAAKKNIKTGEWQFDGKIYHQGKVINSYRKTGFKTKREAKIAEMDYRENYLKEYVSVTFEDLYHEYVPFWSTQVKATTVETECGLYEKLIRDYGDLDLLDSKVLQEIISVCDKKYSKKYVERIYTAFNRVFKWAVKNDRIKSNPMQKVYRSTRPDERRKEMLFFEPDDFYKFLSVIEDQRDRAMFSCLFWMGVRRGEMMALQWKDINFHQNTMSISKTVPTVKRNEADPCNTPKTSNSYRTITMPGKLIDELLRYRDIAEGFSCFGPEMYVFGDDKPISAETLRRKKSQYIEEANRRGYNLPNIRIHDFRHSHASYLINNMSAGFTDFDIAKCLGDTVETLHRVYAHWFKCGDKGIVDFMNSD